LNSGYGAAGNPYFRFFDIRIAEAVTYSGKVAGQWIERELNRYLNKMFKTNRDWILYMDTDSLYIDCSEFVDRFMPEEQNEDKIVDFLDKVAERLQDQVIRPAYIDLQKKTNCMTQEMEMKRESIASDAFWKTKKKYAMRVLDSEGVRETDIKIVGLEAVSSKTPTFCRKGLKDAIKLILSTKDQKELIKFTEGFKEEFLKQAIEDIAEGSGVNGLRKWSDNNGLPISGSPWHVKASLLYNSKIREYNIDKKFREIGEGDKVKLIHLKTPNPFRATTLAFIDFLPHEFKIEKYLDLNAMFEKGFLSPLRETCKTFDFNVENVNDISDFFS